MPSSGYRQKVRWGNETRYASSAVIDKDLGAVQSISPGERNNLIKVRTLGGERDYKTVIPGKFEISASMEYLLQGGDFIRQAFGEDTATTTTVDSGPYILSAGDSVYRHVMGSANSPGVTDFPSFTLEFADFEAAGTTANLRRTYRGCRVNTFTMSGNVDDPVRCTVDWMARAVDVATTDATSITEYTTEPFVFYDGFVYLTSAAVTGVTTQADLNSAAISQVLSFDFTLNNNVEAHWYIAGTVDTLETTRSAKHVIPKGRDYELRLGLHYQDKTMYERFLGALGATTDQKTLNKFQIALDLVKSGTPGTVASGDHYARLVLSSAVFDDIAINGAPEDIVNNDVTVFCKDAKMYFVDNVSSYQ